MRPFPSLLRYPIRGLAPGTHAVLLEAPAEALDVPPFFGTISVSGEIRVADNLYFHLHIRGTSEFICDRCARQFMRPVETEIDVSFEREERESHHGLAEVFTYDPAWHEVDLTEVIRDHLMLALPMKNLCSGACEGIPVEAWEPDEPESKSTLWTLYEKLRSEEMNDESKQGVITRLK